LSIDRRVAGRALIAVGAAAILVGGIGLLTTGGNGSPTANAVATPTATAASASRSFAPTAPSPSLASAPATSTPGPTTQPDETVAAFLARWTAAFQTDDSAFLIDRLNPIVIARYGVPACLQAIHRQLDPAEVSVLRASSGPATWTWVASGLSVQVADVYTAHIDRTFKGGTGPVTFHFALVSGILTWFDTCGTPLP
jgi:hypothetical protein